jgi:hypothetical protein
MVKTSNLRAKTTENEIYIEKYFLQEPFNHVLKNACTNGTFWEAKFNIILWTLYAFYLGCRLKHMSTVHLMSGEWRLLENRLHTWYILQDAIRSEIEKKMVVVLVDWWDVGMLRYRHTHTHRHTTDALVKEKEKRGRTRDDLAV